LLNRRSLFALTALTCITFGVQGAAVRTNAGFTSGVFGANDDGSTGPHNLGFTVNLFGVSTGQVFVNNNGNITIGSGLGQFTPQPISSLGRLIIAPFWADVDTRGAGSSLVTFGQSTVDGNAAFGVNWVDVGYFANHTDRTNSFQLVLVNRGDTCPPGVPDCGNFDMEFNYDRVQWETGDASGGSGGLNGSSARVGYTNGFAAGGDYELAGSAINGAFLDGGPNALISGSFNSTVPGRYLFQVRNSSVGTPGSAQTLPLLPSLVLADASAPGGVRFVFNNVASGQWFDPPNTYGFDYVASAGTLFSSIILPNGFAPFTVQYGTGFGSTLGVFNGGTIIDFVALLGNAIDAFRVIGIDPTVNSDNTNAFPTFINFVGLQGSFTMTPLVNPVPEPSAFLLALAPLGYLAWRRRRA
jgi:hypothetical protein